MDVFMFNSCFYLCMFMLQLVTMVRGQWPWGDAYTQRPLDGSLRCYQCSSNSQEKPERAKLCSFSTWKYANFTEKRYMIMQCPRAKSAFCHSRTRLDPPDPNNTYAERGCFGPKYAPGGDRGGAQASVGCFNMNEKGTTYRVCLCDTLLCNSAQHAFGFLGLFILLQSFVNILIY